MFEEQARFRPDSIALYNDNCTVSMTYGELEQQSNKLAVELQLLGVQPNNFVGILTGEKTFEMYVAVLGVLKSGAAYVPMDAVLFPQERIKFIVEDTSMKLMVTSAGFAGLAERVRATISSDFEKVVVEHITE